MQEQNKIHFNKNSNTIYNKNYQTYINKNKEYIKLMTV